MQLHPTKETLVVRVDLQPVLPSPGSKEDWRSFYVTSHRSLVIAPEKSVIPLCLLHRQGKLSINRESPQAQKLVLADVGAPKW